MKKSVAGQQKSSLKTSVSYYHARLGATYSWAAPSVIAELTEPQLFGYAEAALEIEDDRAERAAILLVEQLCKSPFGSVIGLKNQG